MHIVRTNRIYDRVEEELLEELQKGISITEYTMRLQELKRQREEDLKAGATGGDESLDELRQTFFEEKA
ncbi:hypothetical protein D3C76_1782810 [compost metagenome]